MAWFQQLKEMRRAKISIRSLAKGGKIIISELVSTPQLPDVSVLLHSMATGVRGSDYISM